MIPFALPVGIKGLGPEPDERGFPARPDLDPIRIFCAIPHRNVRVPFPAADALRLEADDVDCMGAEGDHAKETETIGRGAADCLYRFRCPHRVKARIGLCDGLQRFQPLQFFKDRVPGSRENRACLTITVYSVLPRSGAAPPRTDPPPAAWRCVRCRSLPQRRSPASWRSDPPASRA